MSTIKADTIQNTSGGAVTLTDQTAAKAWVNFNGTGTVAVRDNFNVSSITDNGTGDYTVNFSSSFGNANYNLSAATKWQSGQEGFILSHNTNTTVTASAIRLINGVPGTNLSTALTPRDETYIFALFHGDLA